MKICYIISTCDKYLDTRVKYQMDTFLSDVDKQDIFYLTSKQNIEKRHFGWNCMDDSQNITWKYIHFIKNMNNILEYDWYIFIDDDTFVFIDRLKHLLTSYNKDELYYIGNELNHIQKDFCLYMSGGGGYAISNGLYKLIFEHINTIGINNAYYPLINLKEQFCDDLCIGLWINELKEKHNIIQIDNKNFLTDPHKNENELNNAITIHRTITAEAHQFYYNIVKQFKKEEKDTTFVIVTDLNYFKKAQRTIIDLRSRGNWKEDIVVITIDFKLNANFKEFYNIIEVQFSPIDKSELLSKIGQNGFSNSDKREITKLNQWEKLHVFDDYFMKWKRVVFLDAGLRVLDDVKYLLELDYKGKFLAPKDGRHDNYNLFNCQLSYDNSDMIEKVKRDLGENILNDNYFLNSIWIYDTNILRLCDKNQMIEAMNTYTLCRTNEMGIMNLLLRFKYNLWEPFPFKISSGKILFDWCELNNPNTNWKDYCYIKYPVTISFDDC
jgi:hypothetical protein